MTREYSNKRSARVHASAPQQILVMAVCFLLGYFTATVFDIEAISRWVNSQVLAHQEAQKELPTSQVAHRTTTSSKPKFEFYTLLTDDKVPNVHTKTSRAAPTTVTTVANTTSAVQTAAVTAVATVPAVKPPPPNMQSTVMARPDEAKTSGSGNYLVQVAAFKARQDAEHMKGSLVLKGFNVRVVPVHHVSKGLWFRVVVGPYANRSLAQRAQTDLVRSAHLRGMITTG